MSQTPPPLPQTVEVISYATPTKLRPGLLTAMGIISIIVGILGVLAGAWSILLVVSMISLNQMGTAVPPPPPPVMVAPTATASEGAVEPDAQAANVAITTQAAAAPFPMGNPFGNMPAIPFAVYGVISTVEAGLNIGLFAVGIMLMSNRPSARKYHLSYAKWKIVASVLCAVAAGWAYYTFYSVLIVMMSQAGTAVPGNSAWGVTYMAVTMSGISLIMSCAYPLAVLIVFNQKAIREYYG